jgi:hypothetical protein
MERKFLLVSTPADVLCTPFDIGMCIQQSVLYDQRSALLGIHQGVPPAQPGVDHLPQSTPISPRLSVMPFGDVGIQRKAAGLMPTCMVALGWRPLPQSEESQLCHRAPVQTWKMLRHREQDRGRALFNRTTVVIGNEKIQIISSIASQAQSSTIRKPAVISLVSMGTKPPWHRR